MMGGKVFYFLFQEYAIVKLNQKITWEMSTEISALFSFLLKNPALRILYLDMSETVHVDSTILGTIVHLKKNADNVNVKVVICSPSKQCVNILIDVGLNKVLKIDNGSPPKMEIASELLFGTEKTIQEIEALIKDAHEELVNLNDKNKKQFSSVIDSMKTNPL